MSNDTQDRLTDLEIKFAHQEMALENLTENVRAQDKTILELQTLVNTLREKLISVGSGEGQIGPGDEKPPHY